MYKENENYINSKSRDKILPVYQISGNILSLLIYKLLIYNISGNIFI